MTTDKRMVPTGLDEPPVLAAQRRVMQELERHGYLADRPSAGSLTVYRHPTAPSLLVRDDGRLELLSDEPRIQSQLLQPRAKRIHRGRALLVISLLGATTFLGLLVVAMILG